MLSGGGGCLLIYFFVFSRSFSLIFLAFPACLRFLWSRCLLFCEGSVPCPPVSYHILVYSVQGVRCCRFVFLVLFLYFSTLSCYVSYVFRFLVLILFFFRIPPVS